MESNAITIIFLPLVLATIMLGMGLNLKLADFKLVAERPKVIVVGLILQFLILPAIAWSIAEAASLTPELSVGLVLIAACPIGTIANFMVHITKGDSAYSITLTAICSLLSVLTIPLVINLATQYFMKQESHVSLPVFSTILQIFLMIIFPVGIGMLIKETRPQWALKIDRPLRAISLLFLVLLVAGAIVKERDNVISFFKVVGGATFALNCAALFAAFLMGRVFFDRLATQRALIIGTGMRNSALAIAIASSPTLLNSPTMAIPPAIYTITMFLSVVLLVGVLRLWDNRNVEGKVVEA